MSIAFWEQFYDRPPEKIPWQHTQADWLQTLLSNGKLSGGNLIDLGCGTGKKSIDIVQSGAYKEAHGIDISSRAIEIAKQNAEKSGLENVCTFTQADVSEWEFVNNNVQFDLALDWALLHCLPKSSIPQYIDGINAHTKPGSKLLLRTFKNEPGKNTFHEENAAGSQNINMFSLSDIKNLFGQFKVLNSHKSQASTKDFEFIEVLMEKVK